MKITTALIVGSAAAFLSACNFDGPPKAQQVQQPCYDLQEHNLMNAEGTFLYLLNRCTGEVWTLDKDVTSPTYKQWVFFAKPPKATTAARATKDP